ncbi:MAG: cytochrome c biogenesis CcdA family protein, partial [Methylotenera sp.]|nr:cytochrome c biogenesis CcdA family protein [Methylotenera sp.]
MIASFGVYGLSLLAGVLSILSPCVLPLVPILVGTALNTHRYGPYALALGLAISFTAVGVFIATIGASIGIDQEVFRVIAAVLLITFGIVLLSSTLQEKFASATAGIGGSGNTLLSKVSTDSLSGQFVLGLLLGIVWSPCVGPVLGATITLASQGANLAHVTLVMALFGLGAGLPLILLGLLSRQAMMRVRSKLFTVGKIGKRILGAILLLVGLLIITGLDKQFETLIVAASPDWLISLTTR